MKLIRLLVAALLGQISHAWTVRSQCASGVSTRRGNSCRLLASPIHSIDNDKIVIPILSAKSRTKAHNYTIVQPHSGIARVTTQELFPFDLSFAITVFKAQGKTMPKVVLALAHRYAQSIQFSYSAIYVALSRVKHASDIRLLLHDNGSRPGYSGLQYITHLKHDIHVLDYYKGYTLPVHGQLWNAQKTLSFKKQRPQK